MGMGMGVGVGQAGLGVPRSLSSPKGIFHLREGREEAQRQERRWTSPQTAMVGGRQGTLGTSCWGVGALDQGLYLMPGSCILSPSRGPRTCGFAEVSPHADPAHDGPRELCGTCWESPGTHGHVCRRVPAHGPWCQGEGGPRDQKQFHVATEASAGARRDRAHLQTQP